MGSLQARKPLTSVIFLAAMLALLFAQGVAVAAPGVGSLVAQTTPTPATEGEAALSVLLPIPTDKVHVCRVTGTVDPGMARYIGRVIRDASTEGASVLLVVDSLGGRVDSALEIRDHLLRADIPTIAYVEGRAWSAAALIAMAAERLIMQPGSSIGAAEPSPLTVKTLAAVQSEFEATAEARGRDSMLAAAMVDSDVSIPGLVERGRLLSMTAGTAVERGFADSTAPTLREALNLVGLGAAAQTDVPMSAAEKLAQLVTHPAVAPVLLTIALVALVVEVFTAGFGAAGVVGLVSLALYFGGHLIAGFGGWEVTALFVLGLILLMIETFVPGFGIFGIGGIASMIGSFYLASRSSADALRSLVIAVIASLLLSVFLLRIGMRRGWFSRLMLGQSLAADQGFIAREQRTDLIGQRGVATTMLRPAGTARFGEVLVDVVSEGMFVPAGTSVTVVRVEGPRVVVSETKDAQ